MTELRGAVWFGSGAEGCRFGLFCWKGGWGEKSCCKAVVRTLLDHAKPASVAQTAVWQRSCDSRAWQGVKGHGVWGSAAGREALAPPAGRFGMCFGTIDVANLSPCCLSLSLQGVPAPAWPLCTRLHHIHHCGGLAGCNQDESLQRELPECRLCLLRPGRPDDSRVSATHSTQHLVQQLQCASQDV